MKKLTIFLFFLLFCYLKSFSFTYSLQYEDTFLKNITVYFTDLNEQIYQKNRLASFTHNLQLDKLPEQFKINLGLQYRNISFYNAKTNLPLILWGGVWNKEELKGKTHFDFKIESLSRNFEKIINSYIEFWKKKKVISNILKTSSFLPDTLLFKEKIKVIYGKEINDISHQKPLLFFSKKETCFYISSDFPVLEQIKDFFVYYYLSSIIENLKVYLTTPLGKRNHLFFEKIGDAPVQSLNTLVSNLKIFLDYYFWGNFPSSLKDLNFSLKTPDEIKTEIKRLELEWKKSKENSSPQKKLSLLKKLNKLKKRLNFQERLLNSPYSLIGPTGLLLIEALKNEKLSLLEDIFINLKAGKITDNKQLWIFLQKDIFLKNITLKKITPLSPVKKENSFSKVKISQKIIKDNIIEEKKILEALKGKFSQILPQKITQKEKEIYRQISQIKKIYQDFREGKFSFDSFLKIKRAKAKKVFKLMDDSLSWIQLSKKNLISENQTSLLPLFKIFKEKIEKEKCKLKKFLKNEDEKIYFKAESAYQNLREQIALIKGLLKKKEVILGKILFINDKFHFYNRKKLEKFETVIEADIEKTKKDLTNLDFVSLSAKINLYQVIKKLLSDYNHFIKEYSSLSLEVEDKINQFSDYFVQNRFYLTKKLYLNIVQEKDNFLHKRDTLNQKYEIFLKKSIEKYNFSKGNIQKILSLIDNFLKIATSINEDKIYRQLSKSSFHILKENLLVNASNKKKKNMAKESKIISSIKRELTALNSLPKSNKKDRKKEEKIVVAKDKKLKIAILKKNSFYFSNIKVNGRNLEENFTCSVKADPLSINKISISGILHTQGIVPQTIFIEDIDSGQKWITNYNLNTEEFEIDIFPEIIKNYRFKIYFVDSFKRKYCFSKIINIKMVSELSSQNSKKSSENLALLKTNQIQKEKKEEVVNFYITSPQNFLQAFKYSIEHKRMVLLNSFLSPSSNSKNIYSLLSNLNELFQKQENENLQLNFSIIDTQVDGNFTTLTVSYTLLTSQKEISHLAVFNLIKQDGKFYLWDLEGFEF